MRKLFLLLSLLPLWSIAEAAVQLQSISTDYANKRVTFNLAWAAGTRNATHNSKVWVFVDYQPVTGLTTGAWQRATVNLSALPAGCTADGSNARGFWYQGQATAAQNANITVTLTNMPAQFNWCAYATDYPPNATINAAGGYALHGTAPFTVNGVQLGAGVRTYSGTCITSITDPTGCPGLIPAAPTVTTTNPAAVCAGSGVTLTATPGGGTTTATTYTWNIGGATTTTTTTTNTFAVPPASITTSKTFSVTVTNANKCVSNTASGSITVNPLPTITTFTAGPTPICVGGTTTLTLVASGANSYSFDNGATWQASATKAMTPTATTTATAKVRSAAGCVSAAKTLTVTVVADPTITISAAQSICYNTAGSALTATVSGGSGANTYTWQYSADNSAWTAGGTSTTNTLATGNLTANCYYRVMVTQATSGCVSAYSGSVLKTVNPLPGAASIAVTSTACEKIVLSATGTNTTSWVWSNVNASSGAAATVTAVGTRTVYATPVNSCGSGTQVSRSVTVTSCCGARDANVGAGGCCLSGLTLIGGYCRDLVADGASTYTGCTNTLTGLSLEVKSKATNSGDLSCPTGWRRPTTSESRCMCSSGILADGWVVTLDTNGADGYCNGSSCAMQYSNNNGVGICSYRACKVYTFAQYVCNGYPTQCVR